jgi:outer membrane lipoprotein-sorting protein
MNKTFFVLSLTVLALAHAQADEARDIMVKNEAARRLDEMQSTAKLITGTRGGGANKTKEFTIWRKANENKKRGKTLTRFHAPAEVRNEGILIVENDDGKNDVLMYLPSFKKIRRVETQQQSGSFMGSVFSYSDIATPSVDDYQYKKLATEVCPTADAKTAKCNVIEATPATEDVRDRTGYAKSKLWVRADNNMLVQAEYFDLQGAPFKKLQASRIHQVDAGQNKWHADYIEIENLKNKEFTQLEFSNVKINTGIPNSTFTQQNLQKVN